MPKGHNPEHVEILAAKYRWALEDIVAMLSFREIGGAGPGKALQYPGSHIEDVVRAAVRRRALRALQATEDEVMDRVRVRKGPEV